MRVISILVIFLLVALGALSALIYSGMINVTAKEPEPRYVRWFLQTAKIYSVQHHANRNVKPPDLNDPSLIEEGYRHYQETCVSCHGAPGIPPSRIGKGLRPPPPELAEELYPWSDAELFWIIDNGITMTGMPALGPAHSDAELWAIVAFVKRLRGMTPEEYQSFQKHHSDGHSH
jgi:mono/diheme cytochrome c family protein